jgi:hypothetical protein
MCIVLLLSSEILVAQCAAVLYFIVPVGVSVQFIFFLEKFTTQIADQFVFCMDLVVLKERVLTSKTFITKFTKMLVIDHSLVMLVPHVDHKQFPGCEQFIA